MDNILVDSEIVFFEEESDLDLFSIIDENKLEGRFSIISERKNIKFESIDKNTLIGNGNCVNYMNHLETSSVDLLLSDPPYNLGNFMHARNTNLVKMRKNQFAYAGWDNLSSEEWEKEMDQFFQESSRIIKKSGTLLLFMSLIKIETIIKLASKYKFYYKTTGVWHKTNPMPRNMNIHFVNSTEAWIYFVKDDTSGTFNNDGKMMHDFIESSLTAGNEKKHGKHPTQKPVKIISHFIKLLSNKNDVVLDPFMGSGTTGVCARKMGRRFIGVDLDENYYEISKLRMLNE
jgi:site-specific DNA-methyltransferase (adenine-specific)